MTDSVPSHLAASASTASDPRAPDHADAAPTDDVPDEELEEDEHDDEIYESSSSPSTETDTLTWINWFCSLPGHEYFCDVAEDFIEDDFNLTGLASLVPFYKEAMEMVLDVEPEEDETSRVPDVSIVESSAELLYGLIHQRYIITRQGLQQMYAKYDANHFGVCPRVYCSQSKLVPCGRSDLPGVDTVKLFCPSCLDMYVPPSSRFLGVDGAFFGTTFPHLLFQSYPPPPMFPSPSPDPESTTETNKSQADGQPPQSQQQQGRREATTPLTSLSKVYVPRIYGFKVSERARSGPRMQWMRMRPRTEGELDWDENAIRPNPAAGSGPGGSGEKGDLFDEDLDEEDDDEEEEEEEEAGGVAAGGASNAGPTGAGPSAKQATMANGEVTQEVKDEDRAVREVANQLHDKLSTTTSVDLDQLPRRTDRAIKPLPTSSSARSSPQQPLRTTSTMGPVAPSPSAHPTSQDGPSSHASFALAASIQKHLDLARSDTSTVPSTPTFDFDLPAMPRPVVHKLDKGDLFGVAASQRIGTAV